jgi:hypothetical protein
VAIADADTAENRLLWRTQPAELSKTVLMRDQSKAAVVKDSAAGSDSAAVPVSPE